MPEHPGAGHIVLVGMMGSGKTTVGRRVARKLDLDFIDTDEELVVTSGREIAEWFSDVGEEEFRRSEALLVGDVLASRPPRVVSTGGGVVLSERIRTLLCEPSHTVVWLRAGPAFLASRITRKSERKSRPLLTGDPLDALEKLDGERRDLYAEVADITIDIEPVMTDAEQPRRKLAQLIVESLEVVGTGWSR